MAVPSTVSTSPRQKSVVIIITKPMRPFMHMLAVMARGMFLAALDTSSAKCTEASAPTKVATFPRKPIQYESPCVDQPPSFRAVANTK